MDEHLVVGLSAILLLGVGAQWLAWRLHLPSILILLVVGFFAGPVTGCIDPDHLFGEMLFPMVGLSVAVILFEGGLTLQATELTEIGGVLRNLLSFGVIVTWGLTCIAAHFFLDLSWPIALLLGAILVVTGPTVIGPLLRHVRPRGAVGRILRWEGIVIDPIGATLAVLIFEVILAHEAGHGGTSIVALGVVRTLLGGGFIGGIGAGLLVLAIRRYWIPDFLHNPVALALVVGVYTLANLLQPEAGLFAVTVMGVILANQKAVSVQHILHFKANLQVVLISSLFVLLAARLQLKDLKSIGLEGVLFLGALILVVRPLSVALSTFRSDLTGRERLFLAWMAPRGIVAAAIASVFAMRLEKSLPEARLLVPAVFLAIVGTVIVYGLSSAWVARKLHLADANPQGCLLVGAHPVAVRIGLALQEQEFPVLIVDSNWEHLSEARMAGLPTFYGNILSQYVQEELDLSGIGRLLAMTENDEVNALAVLHYTELFGKSGVYQIQPRGKESHPRSAVSTRYRGRNLFGQDVTLDSLERAFAEGGQIKASPLTEEFDLDAHSAMYGENAVSLFSVRPGRMLSVLDGGDQRFPGSGNTLLSLVPKTESLSKENISD
ncbi:MAG: sodium:proton antiporter [Planctomycetota bacterium]|jgi:NhaP-type Na+/H+ or K+/H+ antiporter|nr:sodium:proton antiporter [Planctomycetota bacterium]